MKKTKIKVRAYCTEFDIEVTKKEYLDLDEAILYIHKEISDTGQVIELIHINKEDASRSEEHTSELQSH